MLYWYDEFVGFLFFNLSHSFPFVVNKKGKKKKKKKQVLDYSMNYSHVGQRKLHGEWWSHPQSTLLPIVAYYKKKQNNDQHNTTLTVAEGFHFISGGI